MGAPERRNPHWRDGGFGYCGEKTEATNLNRDSTTRLPFRHLHWTPILYSLAIRDAAPGITQSLLVRAWSREIRAALGVR